MVKKCSKVKEEKRRKLYRAEKWVQMMEKPEEDKEEKEKKEQDSFTWQESLTLYASVIPVLL